jgi:uncharacterized repeat protein (TIGR02543 family)
VDVTEDIKKLRANLTTFVQQNSIDEILRVSQKLLDWIPQDFVARYFFAYAKQQQNQPRFIYDFYKEAPHHTDKEIDIVAEHINNHSDLRDKHRIINFFTKFNDQYAMEYLNAHLARKNLEDNYANVPRDIFICHSSQDVAVAEEVVRQLETDGNTCWISTRNLRPNDSENYWKNIEAAILNTTLLLVIGSENSMLSKDVKTEIEIARKNNKKIIEFKIDNVPHNSFFKHVFNGIKWVNGSNEVEQSYDILIKRVFEELNNSITEFYNGPIKAKDALDMTSNQSKSELLRSKVDPIQYLIRAFSANRGKAITVIFVAFVFLVGIFLISRPINPEIELNPIIDSQQESESINEFNEIGNSNALDDVETDYTVTLVSFDRSLDKVLSIENGEKLLNQLPILNREGHTFEGWYLDDLFDKELSADFTLTSDLTLYSKWTTNRYELEYILFKTEIETNQIGLLSNETIKEVGLGTYVTSVLTSQNRLIIWGRQYSIEGSQNISDLITPINITPLLGLNQNEQILSFDIGLFNGVILTDLGRVIFLGEMLSWIDEENFIPYNQLTTDITSMFNLRSTDRIKMLSRGENTFMALSNDGEVFTWGHNNYGQLGNGTLRNSLVPVNITDNFNLETQDQIILVSTDGYRSAAVSLQGRVFTWGDNAFGQLGDSTYTDKFLPNEITRLFNLDENETITKLIIGHHSIVLTSSNRVFTWGSNVVGELGNFGIWINNMSSYPTPIEITENFNLLNDEVIIDVFGSQAKSMAITSNNRVFSWGRWKESIPGILTYEDLVYGDTYDDYKDDNYPIDRTYRFVLNPGEHIKSISLHGDHSAAISTHGNLFTWGSNTYAELGQFDRYQTHRFLFVERPTRIFSVRKEQINSGILSSYFFEQRLSQHSLSFDSRPGINYEFGGWYFDEAFSEIFNIERMPANNLMVYGRWYLNTT